jgi:hypothetical protein
MTISVSFQANPNRKTSFPQFKLSAHGFTLCEALANLKYKFLIYYNSRGYNSGQETSTKERREKTSTKEEVNPR